MLPPLGPDRILARNCESRPTECGFNIVSHPGFDGDFDARVSLAEGEVCHAESEEVSGGVVGPCDAAGVRVGTADRACRELEDVQRRSYPLKYMNSTRANMPSDSSASPATPSQER